MQDYPISLQLRYLQTLGDIATENNSTTIFPIPIDLFKPFIDGMNKTNSENVSKVEAQIKDYGESKS